MVNSPNFSCCAAAVAGALVLLMAGYLKSVCQSLPLSVCLPVSSQLPALSSGSGSRSGLLINLCKFQHSAFCILLLMASSSYCTQVAGKSFSGRNTHAARNYSSHSSDMQFFLPPSSAKICYPISIDFEKRAT